MRVPVLVILAIAMASAAAPARAQTYSPNFPVCLRVFGPANYFECRYSSLAQCAASIQASASRREQRPARAIALAMRWPSRISDLFVSGSLIARLASGPRMS